MYYISNKPEMQNPTGSINEQQDVNGEQKKVILRKNHLA